jgi:transposase
MFITRTTTQKYANGNSYVTYRLLRTYRNSAGMAKKETLLNLGSNFAVPKEQWRELCDRIEQLQNSSGDMLFELELPLELEQEAQRISKLLNKLTGEKNVAKIATTPLSKVKDYQVVDANSVVDSDIRHIGTEHLLYETVRKLRLPEVLVGCGFNTKQANIALASIIGRLIVPSSERSTHRYLTQDSALDEVIGTEFSDLDLRQLYLASDRLLQSKDVIENSLYLREKELFALEEIITLFDITNTYFEGHPQHSGAKLGRSKEKRSDCELVSLGLLLDGSGFPKKSMILPGNISEPQTLKDMLAKLDSKSGTTVIMDAGIATKDNLKYLEDGGYKYICVRRDGDLVMPENDTTLVKNTLQNKVTVSLVTSTDNKVELYCHSTAKEAKSIAFTNKMGKRFEEELTKLASNLPGCDLDSIFAKYTEPTKQSVAIILNDGQVLVNHPEQAISLLIKVNDHKDIPEHNLAEFKPDAKLTMLLQADNEILKLVVKFSAQAGVNLHSKLQSKLRNLFNTRVQATKKNVTREYNKVAIKLGRLKQQYKSVACFYDVEIIPDANKQYATKLSYSKKETALQTRQAGIYCLTSNRTDLTATGLWETYTMLTEIEEAFRSLKSELGMRPVYHQLEQRIDGHIFISILAYHVLHTIRYQLKKHDINNSWDGIRNIMSIQMRTTTAMDLKGGGVMKLRKTSRATPEQAELYRKLEIDPNPCGLKKTYINLPK